MSTSTNTPDTPAPPLPSTPVADPDMVACCTCGYEWQRGRNGSHSCTEHMGRTIIQQAAEISAIRAHVIGDEPTIPRIDTAQAVADIVTQRDALIDRARTLEGDNQTLEAERNELIDQRDRADAQNDLLLAELRQVNTERDELRARLAEIEARPVPAIPDGWRLVPVEPTREMMEAMPALPPLRSQDAPRLKDGWPLYAIANLARWSAALAAAPEAAR